MSRLLLSILPLAVGAAVSPMLLIVATIALSSSTRRLLCGWGVVAGSTAALCVISVVGVFLGATLHHRPHRIVDTGIDLGVAVLLAFLALRQWRNRSKRSTGRSLTDRLGTTSPKQYFIVGGAAMMLNATSIVLFIPAIRIITKSDAGLIASGVALATLFLFILLPVLVPVLLASLFGTHADRALDGLHSFVNTYTVEITVSVELLFSLYFLVKGLIELGT